MARPRKHDGVVYQRNDSKTWWMRYRDKTGRRCLESTNTTDWEEAQRQLRERLQSRDNNALEFIRKGKQLTFNELANFFLENYSKPPIRAPKTHEANENALKTLRPAFGNSKLVDIDATKIEIHLRERLGQKRHARRKSGTVEIATLKATTVHQEFRVLRRILSVAVKKKMVPTNPCAAVEFPVMVKGMFRPHYVTSTEQARIEKHAPAYLRNVVRIITETGLRVYKELACMKKDQVDLANKVVFIADSKTPTGISEVPLTDIAVEAFRNQMELAGPGQWLFPSSHKPGEHQSDFKKTWRRTLKRAGVQYFRLYC
jgi:site-specific recombinase XerD